MYFDIYWTVCVFDFLFGAVCSIYRSSVNADWAQKIEPACLWSACSETLPFRRRSACSGIWQIDSNGFFLLRRAFSRHSAAIQWNSGWPYKASRVAEISIPEFQNSAMPSCSFITARWKKKQNNSRDCFLLVLSTMKHIRTLWVAHLLSSITPMGSIEPLLPGSTDGRKKYISSWPWMWNDCGKIFEINCSRNFISVLVNKTTKDTNTEM